MTALILFFHDSKVVPPLPVLNSGDPLLKLTHQDFFEVACFFLAFFFDLCIAPSPPVFLFPTYSSFRTNSDLPPGSSPCTHTVASILPPPPFLFPLLSSAKITFGKRRSSSFCQHPLPPPPPPYLRFFYSGQTFGISRPISLHEFGPSPKHPAQSFYWRPLIWADAKKG